MNGRDEYPLADVADRFRRAARSEPVWSDPTPGTWEAIAAATGVTSAAPPPAGTVPQPAAPTPSPRGVGRRTWLFGVGGLLIGAGAGLATGWLTGGDDVGEAVRRAVLILVEPTE